MHAERNVKQVVRWCLYIVLGFPLLNSCKDDYIYDNTTDNVIIEDNTYLDDQFKNLIGEVKLLLASGMKFSSEMRNKEAEQEVQSILNEIKMMK